MAKAVSLFRRQAFQLDVSAAQLQLLPSSIAGSTVSIIWRMRVRCSSRRRFFQSGDPARRAVAERIAVGASRR